MIEPRQMVSQVTSQLPNIARFQGVSNAAARPATNSEFGLWSTLLAGKGLPYRSAGFPTCRIADFQSADRPKLIECAFPA